MAFPPAEIRPPVAHPLVSTVPAVAARRQGQPAGLVSRLLANGLDLLVVLLFLGVAYLAACGWQLLVHPSRFSFPSLPRGVVLGISLGFSLIYLTLCWWLAGRTYGDRVMALRVVNFRRRKPLFPSALVRALLYVAFPVGVLWCAVNRSSRSVQDVVLRTSVIYDWTD
jgi:uncharacterized RDD family membrane protein YckC